MKKGKLAAICLAGVLGILACLGTFFSVKKVVSSKAEYALPPGQVVGSEEAYISSLYGMDISFRIGNSSESLYGLSYSVPYLYEEGLGSFVYQGNMAKTNSSFSDIGFMMNLQQNSYNSLYLRFLTSLGQLDVDDRFLVVSFRYSNGLLYLNRDLYRYLFSLYSFSVYGLNTNNFFPYLLRCGFNFNKFTEEGFNGSFVYSDEVSGNGKDFGLVFPFWSTLQDNGLVNSEGFVCLSDFSFDVQLDVSNLNDDVVFFFSSNLDYMDAKILVSDFHLLQKDGFNSFIPYMYEKVPVDDIGLGSITNAVSAFFNVEFIPGFRLWYFLLIGLGCAIVGIALKFFLGG